MMTVVLDVNARHSEVQSVVISPWGALLEVRKHPPKCLQQTFLYTSVLSMHPVSEPVVRKAL